MKPLRAGVIGVGHLGQHHARHYATLPGATLVGVCDAEPSRAKLIADRHGVQAWTQLPELLKQVEIVRLATHPLANAMRALAISMFGESTGTPAARISSTGPGLKDRTRSRS